MTRKPGLIAQRPLVALAASPVADEEPTALLAQAEEALTGPGPAADTRIVPKTHGPQPRPGCRNRRLARAQGPARQ